MLCRRDERLPLHSPGLIRIEVTNSAITYQVGSQLILTRTSPIVKRVNEVLRMGAQFSSQQWLRTWLTDHRGRLKLAVAVVVGAGATAILAQGSRRSQPYFSAGSIAGNLKSFCLLRPQSRRIRIVNDFAATTPPYSRHFVAEFQAALTQFLHETAQNACHSAGAAHHL